MNKIKIYILCSLAVFLLTAGIVLAVSYDWGKIGVSDTGYVRKIVQVTDNALNDELTGRGSIYYSRYLPNPWSSDGKWIAYTAEIDANGWSEQEICKIKPDGSGFMQLTDNSVTDSNAQFTPDGSGVVFERSGESIFIVDSNGSGETDLTSAHSGVNVEKYPVVSPDGTKIAYYSNNHIWVMNIDGSGETQVSVFFVPDTSTLITSFSWSPDSAKIAYCGYYISGSTYKIYTVNSDGSGANTMIGSADSVEEKSPAWSPDGLKIAYIAKSGATEYLKQMDTNGSAKQTLVQTGSTGEWSEIRKFISWSPDSRWILYTKPQRLTPYNNSIFIVNRYAGEEIQLTNSYEDYFPRWNPDGRSILFQDLGNNTSRDDSLSDDMDGDLLLLKLIPRSISATNFLILY